MKVLVTGSRDWTDAEAIFDVLSGLAWSDLREGRPLEIIHGGAPGADSIAATIAADELFLPVREFRADWQTHGKAAGPIRNLAMLDQAPDLVLAFQRNGSRGTQHTIDEARKRGIPVEVYTA